MLLATRFGVSRHFIRRGVILMPRPAYAFSIYRNYTDSDFDSGSDGETASDNKRWQEGE
jgi:hypothetical protein